MHRVRGRAQMVRPRRAPWKHRLAIVELAQRPQRRRFDRAAFDMPPGRDEGRSRRPRDVLSPLSFSGNRRRWRDRRWAMRPAISITGSLDAPQPRSILTILGRIKTSASPRPSSSARGWPSSCAPGAAGRSPGSIRRCGCFPAFATCCFRRRPTRSRGLDRLGGTIAALRDEIRGELALLRDEIRGELALLRDEIRSLKGD